MSVEVMSGGGASPKLQTKTATPSTSSQSVTPDDGYDGLSEVTVSAMPSGSLNSPTISSSGLVTAQVGTGGYLASGTNKTLQLTTQASKTVTPSTSNQTAVASGRYTTGAVTVKGDSNLVASNIKSGVSIFGVSGTLEEALYQTTTSTITNNSTNRTLTIQNFGFPIYSRSNIVSLSIELISDGADDLTATAWHYNYYSNCIACCIFDNSGTNGYWENFYSGGSYYIINCNGSNIEVGFTRSSNQEFSSGTYKYTLVVKKE